ncbi:MAG: hypothetical protein U1E53_06450 [Dongiaceae bacterium]
MVISQVIMPIIIGIGMPPIIGIMPPIIGIGIPPIIGICIIGIGICIIGICIGIIGICIAAFIESSPAIGLSGLVAR